MLSKNYFFGTFLSVCCIQIEKKTSFKLKKIYVQGKYFNLMLGEHLEAHLIMTLKHGQRNKLTSFQHNHYFWSRLLQILILVWALYFKNGLNLELGQPTW